MTTTRRPRKIKPRRDELKPGECLCDHCTGKCCRYFSLPIETPTTWDDYDAIRWYLAHGRTIIYVEKGTWYLLVMSRCNYLTADNRCGIYFNRPKICREYTTTNCEYDADWSFEQDLRDARADLGVRRGGPAAPPPAPDEGAGAADRDGRRPESGSEH